jgi:hypothetical protein
MGLQPVEDVTLIRHAYVLSSSQKRGIGSQLLSHLRNLVKGPVLLGTWADAVWAVRFYEKHGFRMVDSPEKDRLLKNYWSIPQCQTETSVVLADRKWWELGDSRLIGTEYQGFWRPPRLPRSAHRDDADWGGPSMNLTYLFPP